MKIGELFRNIGSWLNDGMKHLLSILTLLGIVSLVVVSCSKSPEQYIENCADDKVAKIYLEEINDLKIELKGDFLENREMESCKMIGGETYGKKRRLECIEDIAKKVESSRSWMMPYLAELEKLYSNIKNLTLEQKIMMTYSDGSSLEGARYNYEEIFYTCSKEFKDEETIFKAKWK